jgi:hypothetical protein
VVVALSDTARPALAQMRDRHATGLDRFLLGPQRHRSGTVHRSSDRPRRLLELRHRRRL